MKKRSGPKKGTLSCDRRKSLRDVKKGSVLCGSTPSLRMGRREFLRVALAGAVYFALGGLFPRRAFAQEEFATARPKSNIKGDHDIVAAEGKDAYQNTVKAVGAMGGMERFIKKSDVVVVKPNIAWDRTPEQAATTDPAVVAALVEMCYKAGAKRVNVFDIPCNEERHCYANSGIMEAAKAAGARVYYADTWNVLKARFGYESPMEGWPILKDAIVCDKFINVPVLKHHSLTMLTLSMKNLMGVCGGRRGLIHVNIGRKLVDLTDFINPDLTVIDATRVLIRNGPSGGNLKDVVAFNKVIVATDPTLADTFAARLVGTDPMEVPYIRNAAERHIGSTDLEKANILNLKD